MPVTRAQVEAVMVGAAPVAGAGLVGALLARVGYDASGESPIASLSDAITEGLIECGVVPEDVTSPTDSDLANLPPSLWQKFRDIAELRLLELVSAGGTSGGLKSITFDDFTKVVAVEELGKLLATKRQAVRNRWGYGAASLKAGSYRVGGGECSEF
jgi:hypothetical protein